MKKLFLPLIKFHTKKLNVKILPPLTNSLFCQLELRFVETIFEDSFAIGTSTKFIARRIGEIAEGGQHLLFG